MGTRQEQDFPGRMSSEVHVEGQVRSILTQLAETKRGPKGVFENARKTLMRPNVHLAAIDYLERFDEGDPYVRQLYTYLTNTKYVREHYASEATGYSVEGFVTVVNALNGPHVLAAQDILRGYFDRPVDIFKRGRTRESLDKAGRLAFHVSAAYTEALYICLDQESRRRGIRLWDEEAVLLDPDVFCIFDLLRFWEFCGPELEAEQAHSVFEALGVLESFYIGEFQFDQRQAYNTALKHQILYELSGRPKSRHLRLAQMDKSRINAAVKSFLGKNAKAAVSITSLHSTENRLDVFATDLLLQYWVNATHGEFLYEMINYPKGSRDMVIWKGAFVTEPEKRTEMKKQIVHQLGFLKGYSNELTTVDLDVVLEHIRSHSDDQHIMSNLPYLLQETRGGLHGVNVRGYRNEFTLSDEEWLRNLGFTYIEFRQRQAGIHVTIGWENWKYELQLNRQYEPEGMTDITWPNRAWLLRIIYEYLHDVKNPETSRVVFGRSKNQPSEPRPLGTEHEVKDIAPQLRVLPLGHVCQQIARNPFEKDDEVVSAEAYFHFGVTVREVNIAFYEVQQDLRRITDFPPLMRDILKMFIRRVIAREENTRWMVQVKEDGAFYKPMTVRNPPRNLRRLIYEVSFVRPPEQGYDSLTEIPPPEIVICSQAAARLVPKN